VIESWRLVIGNAVALARLALLPFLIFVALNRLEKAFMPEGMSVLAWDLLFMILAGPPAVMLLMPWYRRLLAAGDPSLASPPAMGWSLVLMLRWAGLDILFFMAVAPALAMLTQAAMVGGEFTPRGEVIIFNYASIIVGSYLFYGRMGLALPAAAAGADHRYRRSWAMTSDNGWRIGLAILLCALPLEFLIGSLRAPLLVVENPTPTLLYLDAALGAVFRIVNELLGAAVFAQYYLARTTAAPEEDED
jgi:hypothetical protein